VKKHTPSIFSIVLGSLLLLGGAGCHKNSAAAAAPKTLQQGVAELRQALATANPVVQSNLFNGVSYGLRYGDYAKASAALEQIASDASLNDQQKKAVNDVNDLVKQAMATAPNPAPPAK
jgi:outer membrane murein-binding lipoprotein Lpp